MVLRREREPSCRERVALGVDETVEKSTPVRRPYHLSMKDRSIPLQATFIQQPCEQLWSTTIRN